MIKKFTMVMLVTGLAACGGENSDSSPVTAVEPRLSTCFWNGPYVKENPAANFAYPDTGAAYWTAEYSLPEGATLKLDGDFPYSRYISYNSYRSDGTPADVVAALEKRDPAGWQDSTEAMRLNALFGGYPFVGEVDALGLDETASKTVRRELAAR